MVIRGNLTLPGDQSRDQKSGGTPVKALLSPPGQKIPTASLSLSPRITRQTSIRRNHSISTIVDVAGPAHTTIPASRLTTLAANSSPTMAQDEKPVDANSDPATQEFQGDIKVSTTLPSKSTLDKIADLPVFDVDGKTVSFKSLYWSDGNESQKVMIIFIRHFFCGNCQEYLRALAAAIPPSSLPSNTSIRIVGCGSHTLIPSYVEQTNCPYPIFADPSKKLYSLLGMARTLSLGHKDPEYIKHTLVAGMVKSIAQGLKRIGSGDILQAGDIKQVGGEFLFEVMGGDMRLSNAKAGSESLKKVEVTWCHRMKNTRDHAELPDLKSALGLNEAGGEEETRRRSEPSWRNSGLARSLSNRRQSLSWTRTRRRSRSAGQKAGRERQPIHAVNEEARIEDGPKVNGRRLATEVKG